MCQRITDAYEEINDVINLLDTYKLSRKIKRMLPTVMIIAQETIYIECFGELACVRESFKKVSKIYKPIANVALQVFLTKLYLHL